MKKRGYPSRVLITGDQGFIGTNLLYSRFFPHVISWDIKLGFDIFDNRLEEAIKESDAVIHLAANTSVEQSFTNASEVFRVNVLGTARVADLCLRYKKKLVFPSTAAVYHRMLSPYAESKGLAEDIVRGIMDKCPVTILRFYNVYGEYMNPNTGSIMYTFLHAKRLFVYGDGDQTRDFIHVQDVCNIIREAVLPRLDGKILDVGIGQAYTINYVAGLFAHYRKLNIEYLPPRREIKWSIADTRALRMFYKKKLVTNLEKDIEKLCLQASS